MPAHQLLLAQTTILDRGEDRVYNCISVHGVCSCQADGLRRVDDHGDAERRACKVKVRLQGVWDARVHFRASELGRPQDRGRVPSLLGPWRQRVPESGISPAEAGLTA